MSKPIDTSRRSRKTPSELFPTVWWDDVQAHFLPDGVAFPQTAPIYAALVFACSQDRLFIADIAGRGWCIPGGRLEMGETAEDAARRETFEEAGLALGPLRLLGRYLLRDRGGNERLAPTYIATVTSRQDLPVSESRGVRLVRWDELPSLYYRWGPLLAAVCNLARQQHEGEQQNKG